MQLANSAERFGLVTKVLHWLIAIAILGLVWLGWYMVDLTYYDRWYNASLAWHKAIGMAVLALGAAKIAWTVVSRPPPPPATLSRPERIAARSAHGVLYLMMIAIPATGYVISTSEGDGIDVFGLFEIPALAAVSEDARDVAIEAHWWLAYGTLALAALHALAAIKHQVIDRDGTLARMLWR